MKEMFKKVLTIIFLVLIIFIFYTETVQAYDWQAKINELDTIESDAGGAKNSVENVMGSMITIMQVVGTGIAIIMLIVVAIKYLLASSGDKADIKKHAVPYVVGATLLFATTGVLEIISKFATVIK